MITKTNNSGSDLKQKRTLTPIKRTDRVLRTELILKNAMNAIKLENNELSIALNIFKLVPVREEGDLATDGIKLFYCPKTVMDYAGERMDYLRYQLYHLVIHGLLGHYEYRAALSNPQRMSTIMDLEVTQLIGMFPSDLFNEKLRSELGATACEYPHDLIYDAYESGDKKRTSLRAFNKRREYLCRDDHALWFNKKEPRKRDSKESGKSDADTEKSEMSMKWQDARMVLVNGRSKRGDIAACLKKTFGGGRAGNMSEDYKVVQKRQKVYYEEFLNDFIKEREICREGDTIDRMIYQYGMELYGDMPLVEPLESSESKAIDTLALAIDTSGSCYQSDVKKFLYVTAKIFQRLGADVVFERIILFQCDSEIKKRYDIKNIEELKEMAELCDVYGGGGTDFRPVFKSLDFEAEQGTDIDGLIYLTDAVGNYPEQKPSYPVTFVLPKEQSENDMFRVVIPEWIKQVELREDNANV